MPGSPDGRSRRGTNEGSVAPPTFAHTDTHTGEPYDSDDQVGDEGATVLNPLGVGASYTSAVASAVDASGGGPPASPPASLSPAVPAIDADSNAAADSVRPPSMRFSFAGQENRETDSDDEDPN